MKSVEPVWDNEAPASEVGYIRLGEMRELLRARDLMLTKSLGQNFLHDGNILRKIVEAGGVRGGEKVLEIGPGMGALTGPLLDSGASVHAIEKDSRLVEFLQEDRLKGHPRFSIQHGDALAFLKSNDLDWNDWKLISNLPYSVGSPIIVEMALGSRPPQRMVVTLQLEVIQKIMAHPGSKNYGLLSILMQMQYRPGSWFKLPSGCFFPPPDVMSACGVLELRETPVFSGREELLEAARIAKMAFRKRRKTLTNSLRPVSSPERIIEVLESFGHSAMARPEELTPDQFILMAREIGKVD